MLSKFKGIIFLFLISINIFADVNISNPTTTPTGESPNLSSAGKNAWQPQIAASSQYAYAVWKRVDENNNTIIQAAISSDYGNTWSYPTTTPSKSSPNLSIAGQNASRPQIVTSGQYVYAIWKRVDGSNKIIQVIRSTNYGETWESPTTTPGGTPNLSVLGRHACQPQIKTNNTGQYVYAIWKRFYECTNVIQVAISSDYGDTWQNPTTTPTGDSPNLSNCEKQASKPQIATDTTGQYVYAVWKRFDGSNKIIQVAISSDYGDTWENPTTTPTGVTPNLSESGKHAYQPQIATDTTGQYVYAIWRIFGGSHYVIQIAISSNYGQDWQNPTTTPTGDSPNLSGPEKSAYQPQIATSGEYVYVIWKRFDGLDTRIQVVISSDYGDTWQNPTTTPTGDSPNLSAAEKNAFHPQIITDSTGQYVYAVWQILANYWIIQAAISSDYGDTWVNPTTTPTGNSPNISQSGDEAFQPQITTDSTGEYIYALWERYDENNNKIIQTAKGIND